MDLAKRQPVGHFGDALSLRVRNDVRGIEQLRVLEIANGARAFVSTEHSGTEHRLVKARLDETLRISPLILLEVKRVLEKAERFIESDTYGALGGVVMDDVRRIEGHEVARSHPKEVDQRFSTLERAQQFDVVSTFARLVRVRDKPFGTDPV